MKTKCLNQVCVHANLEASLVEKQKGRCDYCKVKLGIYVPQPAPEEPTNSRIGRQFDASKLWSLQLELPFQ